MNFYHIFITFILGISLIILWGLKNFHKDNYQFLVVIPYKKLKDNVYRGLNITFYGIITAFSYTVSVFIFISLIKLIEFPEEGAYFLVIVILVVGFPSSKILAYLIENRKNTLTVGGAIFVSAIISVPTVFLVIVYLNLDINQYFLPILTSLSISATLGEGIGRLACLSFGCCYGKPMKQINFLPSLLKVKFNSSTKKAVYDSNYVNVELLNIQGLVVIVYTFIALSSILLFISQKYYIAFILTFIIPPLIRFFSEFLRDDHRGSTKISIYQVFSIILSLYGLFFLLLFYKRFNTVIELNINLTYSLIDLVVLASIFFITFWHTGISKVTDSEIKFQVKS